MKPTHSATTRGRSVLAAWSYSKRRTITIRNNTTKSRFDVFAIAAERQRQLASFAQDKGERISASQYSSLRPLLHVFPVPPF